MRACEPQRGGRWRCSRFIESAAAPAVDSSDDAADDDEDEEDEVDSSDDEAASDGEELGESEEEEDEETFEVEAIHGKKGKGKSLMYLVEWVGWEEKTCVWYSPVSYTHLTLPTKRIV